MADANATTNGFFDVQLSDIFGAGLKVYEDDQATKRVGSGGAQPQTSPNAPAPAVVNAPSSPLPEWALYLLIGSVALLGVAVSLKALK